MQLGILIVLSLQMKFLTWKQYTQHWVTAKMESGLLGTLPFLGRSASFVPKNNSLKTHLEGRVPAYNQITVVVCLSEPDIFFEL